MDAPNIDVVDALDDDEVLSLQDTLDRVEVPPSELHQLKQNRQQEQQQQQILHQQQQQQQYEVQQYMQQQQAAEYMQQQQQQQQEAAEYAQHPPYAPSAPTDGWWSRLMTAGTHWRIALAVAVASVLASMYVTHTTLSPLLTVVPHGHILFLPCVRGALVGLVAMLCSAWVE